MAYVVARAFGEKVEHPLSAKFSSEDNGALVQRRGGLEMGRTEKGGIRLSLRAR